MKKAIKLLFHILEFSIILLFLISVFYYKLVSYGIDQGIGQMKIVWGARPITEILADPAVQDTIKSKLQLIEEIKKFAIDSLGLKESKNYTTMYDQHGKPLLWVLSAAEKYRMVSYEWKFPVVGKVGYKGFFRFDKGKKERQELIEKGFDTDYGITSAWSTLGWFRDPILSNVLSRSEGQLAELFIHEMTHATLYVKSSVDFNENLASFIGEEGAIQFLRYKHGDSSEALMDFIFRKEDYDLFSNQMLAGMERLDSLYKTFNEQTADTIKAVRKKNKIKEIVSSLDVLPFHQKQRYSKFFADEMPNNAFFLSYKRYDSQKDEMKKEMQEKFNNDFRRYLNYLKAKYK